MVHEQDRGWFDPWQLHPRHSEGCQRRHVSWVRGGLPCAGYQHGSL